MTRNALRARNITLVASWLATYVLQGHSLTLETRCGPAPDDNEVVFRVSDWAAFARIMDGRQDATERRSA